MLWSLSRFTWILCLGSEWDCTNNWCRCLVRSFQTHEWNFLVRYTNSKFLILLIWSSYRGPDLLMARVWLLWNSDFKNMYSIPVQLTVGLVVFETSSSYSNREQRYSSQHFKLWEGNVVSEQVGVKFTHQEDGTPCGSHWFSVISNRSVYVQLQWGQKSVAHEHPIVWEAVPIVSILVCMPQTCFFIRVSLLFPKRGVTQGYTIPRSLLKNCLSRVS